MQNKGILKHKLDTKNNTVTAAFEEGKTSVDKIIGDLSKGGYPVEGRPEYVKD